MPVFGALRQVHGFYAVPLWRGFFSGEKIFSDFLEAVPGRCCAGEMTPDGLFDRP